MPSKFGGIPVDEQSRSKFGGIPVDEAPAPTATPSPESHPIRDFVGNMATQLNPVPGLKRLATDPGGFARDAVGAQMDQFRQAGADLSNTREMPNALDRHLSALGHTMAGAIPFIGPAAAHAGEQIGSGDVAGGLGTTAGLIAPLAVGPAAAKGAGKIARATAEPIAETALGVRKLDRSYGKTPGASILDETSGVRPETVAGSARSKLRTLNTDLESKAATGPDLNLQPAVDLIDQAQIKAAGRNAKNTVNQLNPVRAHLTQDAFSGSPIPPIVPASRLLQLKRGIGDEFVHNWNPETLEGVRGTAAQAHHALGEELNANVKGARDLNQRISSLIPVAKRAESTSRDAGPIPQVLHKLRTPTGALTGAVAGALEGSHLHGLEGGVAGGAAGLLIPQLVSSPTVQMIAARGLNAVGKGLKSPVTQTATQVLPLLKARRKQEAEAPR